MEVKRKRIAKEYNLNLNDECNKKLVAFDYQVKIMEKKMPQIKSDVESNMDSVLSLIVESGFEDIENEDELADLVEMLLDLDLKNQKEINEYMENVDKEINCGIIDYN